MSLLSKNYVALSAPKIPLNRYTMAQTLTSLNWCDDAKNYPRTSDRTLTPYALDAIRHQLDTQASRLFAEEGQAALDFLDLGNGAQGMLNIIPSR